MTWFGRCMSLFYLAKVSSLYLSPFDDVITKPNKCANHFATSRAGCFSAWFNFSELRQSWKELLVLGSEAAFRVLSPAERLFCPLTMEYGKERVVALVDMDCFYVQVEQRLNAALKNTPCVVAQYKTWKGGRWVPDAETQLKWSTQIRHYFPAQPHSLKPSLFMTGCLSLPQKSSAKTIIPYTWRVIWQVVFHVGTAFEWLFQPKPTFLVFLWSNFAPRLAIVVYKLSRCKIVM